MSDPRSFDPADLDRHASFLHALALGLVGDASTAEDLTQDAMVAALERPPADAVRLRPWLAKVLRNRAFMGWRSEERRTRRESDAAQPETLPSAGAIAERTELNQRLGEAVAGLPDSYRAVVHLRYFEGLSTDEIAARSQTPVETVRSRQRRALELLRQRLDGNYNGNRSAWCGLLALPLARETTALNSIKVITMGSLGVKTKTVAAALVVALVAILAGQMASDPLSPELQGKTAELADGLRLSEVDSEGLEVADAALVGQREVVIPQNEPDPAPALEHLLTGRVLDPKGDPAIGQKVQLIRLLKGAMTSLESTDSEKSRLVSGLLTDTHGSFSFRIAPGVAYILSAPENPDLGTGHCSVVDCYAGMDVVLELSPACAVLGFISERESGMPVADARVQLWKNRQPDSAGGLLALKCNTDAAGRYMLTGLSPGDYTMKVSSARHQESGQLKVSLEAGERRHMNAALDSGFIVRGTVTDANTGLPIPNAEVCEGWSFGMPVRTDMKGNYELRGAGAPGVISFAARAAGYGRSDVLRPVPVDGIAQFDFALRKGRTVVGRVLSTSGLPLGDVYVAAVATRWDQPQQTDWRSSRTDSDGLFVIDSLRPDLPHALLLRAPGSGTCVFDFPKEEREQDHMDLGDFSLGDAGHLEGRIVGPAGEPKGGVRVTLAGWNKDRFRLGQIDAAHLDTYVGVRVVATDAEGHFRFGELPAGTFALEAVVAGQGQKLTKQLTLDQGEAYTGIELTLGAGLPLEGFIGDAQGNPAPPLGIWLLGQSDTAGQRAKGTSNPDGSFRFQGLAPGTYTLLVSESNIMLSGYRILPFCEVVVTAGDLGVNIVLPRSEPIAGMIVDLAGDPVPDAHVASIGPSGARFYSTFSAPDGSFTLEAPVDELVIVRATEPDEGRPIQRSPLIGEAHEVKAGTTGLKIVIPLSR